MAWRRAEATWGAAAWAGALLFVVSAGLPAMGSNPSPAALPNTLPAGTHGTLAHGGLPPAQTASPPPLLRRGSVAASSSTPDAAANPLPSASSRSGDVVETPAVAIPNTTPTNFVIAANMSCPKGPVPIGCNPELNVTAPRGPWDLILLNYTGTSVPSLYDSSFHATVDGVMVLFGTTPEDFTYTVLKNLTEYSALFRSTATVQFSLGDAVNNGYFVISVSLSFYPVPPGATPPRTPSQVVPLWPITNVFSTQPTASVNATVPSDVQNATLELYSYGFSYSGADEFWYTLNPAYRAVNVSVGGVPLAFVQPFEFINTGGIDLFAWNPVTAAYTIDDPPYRVDVTAALGLLEGAHTYNASVVGLGSGSHWTVGGSLLLYTNASVESASLVSDPTPVVSMTTGSSGSGPTESVTAHYSFASTLTYSTGPVRVISWTNESFSMVTETPANGGTINVVHSLTTVQDQAISLTGTEYVNQTSAPSFYLNENSSFVQSSGGSGSTYPKYGNATSDYRALDENWNLTRVDTWAPLGAPKFAQASYVNDNLTMNGSLADEEELISPAAAYELKLDYVFGNTTKIYRSMIVDGTEAAWYNHTVASQMTTTDEQSSGQASLTRNAVTFHDAARLAASGSETDAGQSVTFRASVLGYGAPFTYAWAGLPAGCPTASSTPVITCVSPRAGNYSVTVTPMAVGGAAQGPSPTFLWQNFPDPTINLTLASAQVDPGHSTTLSVSVQASVGPVSCTWLANGLGFGAGTGCGGPVSFEQSLPGKVVVEVVAVDGLGFSVNASKNLTVGQLPSVSLRFSRAASGQIPVLSPLAAITLVGTVVGGVTPYEFHWLQNGSPIFGASNASNYTFARSNGGYYNLTLRITDREGASSTSAPLEIEVASNSSPPGPGRGGSSTSGNGITGPEEALVGVGIVGAVILVALVAWTYRRPKAPTRPPPTDIL